MTPSSALSTGMAQNKVEDKSRFDRSDIVFLIFFTSFLFSNFSSFCSVTSAAAMPRASSLAALVATGCQVTIIVSLGVSTNSATEDRKNFQILLISKMTQSR